MDVSMALLRDLAHDRVDTETCGEIVQGPASSAIKENISLETFHACDAQNKGWLFIIVE
jgi:hypothetical protein